MVGVTGLATIPIIHGIDKHTDRTKSLFVPLSALTAGGTLSLKGHYPSIELDLAAESAYGMFVVPKDYVSGLVAKLVWISDGATNLFLDVNCYWAGHDVAYETNYHTQNEVELAETAVGDMLITDLGINFVTPTAGSAPAVDDLVSIELIRGATTSSHVRILGFVIEYLGDQ